jgi:hypothetical protein
LNFVEFVEFVGFDWLGGGWWWVGVELGEFELVELG